MMKMLINKIKRDVKGDDMQTHTFKHKDTDISIFHVDNDNVIIISSQLATIRIEMDDPSADFADGATWRTAVMSAIVPEVEDLFDDDQWMEFAGDAGINQRAAYDIRDLAIEDGYGSWVAACRLLADGKAELAISQHDRFWSVPDEITALIDALRTYLAAGANPAPKKKEELNIEQVASLCWMALDASNVSGLVISWGEWMPVINRHAQEIGVSQNMHAVNVAMTDKMLELTGLASGDMRAYDAVTVVGRLAGVNGKKP